MAGRGKKKLISEKDIEKAEGYALQGCKNNTSCTLMGWGHNFIEDRPDIQKRLTQKRAERDYALRKSQTGKAKTTMRTKRGGIIRDEAKQWTALVT